MEIDLFVQHLNEGKIILYPTDTVWGIGCDATQEILVERVSSIKKRDRQGKEGFVVLLHPLYLGDYIDCNVDEVLDAYSHCQGPTTFVFESKKGSPLSVSSSSLIAVRVPFGCDYLMSVLKEFGKPILSTSANISGKPFPHCFSEINEHIKNAVDYTIPFSFDSGTGSPSTILSYKDATRLR